MLPANRLSNNAPNCALVIFFLLVKGQMFLLINEVALEVNRFKEVYYSNQANLLCLQDSSESGNSGKGYIVSYVLINLAWHEEFLIHK